MLGVLVGEIPFTSFYGVGMAFWSYCDLDYQE